MPTPLICLALCITLVCLQVCIDISQGRGPLDW